MSTTQAFNAYLASALSKTTQAYADFCYALPDVLDNTEIEYPSITLNTDDGKPFARLFFHNGQPYCEPLVALTFEVENVS